MSGPGIYVASPLGFSEPGARYLSEALHPALIAAGFEVLDPWERGRRLLAALPAGVDEAASNARLGAANAALIEQSSGVLAVLDGSDVDSGTAAEIGFASGIGRVVVGLRSDFRNAGDNRSAPVNLQVLHFLAASGGAYTTTLDDAIGALRERLVEPLARTRIFHLTMRSTWERAQRDGTYRASTRDQDLDEVGFLHCSFEEQLLATATRFYGDVDPADLVVLVIDPERLAAPLVVETAGSGASYPHIYGALNLDAVLARLRLVRAADGFALGAATSA